MNDQQTTNEAACGGSDLTAELGLDAESVQCYLYALLDEAKRRGGMFPQTSDEQELDLKAVRRVCDMVNWYAKQGEPRQSAVAYLHAMRAMNRAVPNA